MLWIRLDVWGQGLHHKYRESFRTQYRTTSDAILIRFIFIQFRKLTTNKLVMKFIDLRIAQLLELNMLFEMEALISCIESTSTNMCVKRKPVNYWYLLSIVRSCPLRTTERVTGTASDGGSDQGNVSGSSSTDLWREHSQWLVRKLCKLTLNILLWRKVSTDLRLLSFSQRYSCISACGSEREWAGVSVDRSGRGRKWARMGAGVGAEIGKRMTKTRSTNVQPFDATKGNRCGRVSSSKVPVVIFDDLYTPQSEPFFTIRFILKIYNGRAPFISTHFPTIIQIYYITYHITFVVDLKGVGWAKTKHR